MYNIIYAQSFCYFLVHSTSNNFKALCWYDLSNFMIIVVIIIANNCNGSCLLMIPELQLNANFNYNYLFEWSVYTVATMLSRLSVCCVVFCVCRVCTCMCVCFYHAHSWYICNTCIYRAYNTIAVNLPHTVYTNRLQSLHVWLPLLTPLLLPAQNPGSSTGTSYPTTSAAAATAAAQGEHRLVARISSYTYVPWPVHKLAPL